MADQSPQRRSDAYDHDNSRDNEYNTERHLPKNHNPLPALSDQRPAHDPTAEEFIAVSETPEFHELKRKFRGFAFPMTVAFLAWYFLFVLLSVYARGFMSKPLFGNVTIGLTFGLLQFVTTFLLTWLYIRHANKNLDPIAANLRAKLEGDR